MSIPLSACSPGTSERASGVRAGADMSIDEPQLPGVLPDLAGLGVLTLARGILSVVTAPEGSCCMRARIDVAGSAWRRLGARDIGFDVELFEKNNGEVGPSSGGWPVAAAKAPSPEVGRSVILGGETPLRRFLFMVDCPITLSGTACLEDDRLTLPRDRTTSGGLR